MNQKYVSATDMLNYQAAEIQTLIEGRGWRACSDFKKIEAVYDFVQNEILFGFNENDNLTAAQVLSDGIGQCNTKATLLMALLRGVNVPCRLHAFQVDKDFQKGATSGLVSILAPRLIVHTWVEVFYKNTWLALEGVILDKAYLGAVQKKFPCAGNEFYAYAIATSSFSQPAVDWTGTDTYIQKEAIVSDLGLFDSPDVFFEDHRQDLCRLKQFFYVCIGSKIMTRNVSRIRGSG